MISEMEYLMDVSQFRSNSHVEGGNIATQILLKDDKWKSQETVGRKRDKCLLMRHPMVWYDSSEYMLIKLNMVA